MLISVITIQNKTSYYTYVFGNFKQSKIGDEGWGSEFVTSEWVDLYRYSVIVMSRVLLSRYNRTFLSFPKTVFGVSFGSRAKTCFCLFFFLFLGSQLIWFFIYRRKNSFLCHQKEMAIFGLYVYSSSST